MTTKTEYQIQPLAWVVKPKGSTVDGDDATTITRTHEGDGQFIEVAQSAGGEIRITLEEWPAIKQAIEAAFDAILSDELHDFAPEPEAPADPEPTGAELVGKTCWVRDADTEPWRGPRTLTGYDPEKHKKYPYLEGPDGARGFWAHAKRYREGVAP